MINSERTDDNEAPSGAAHNEAMLRSEIGFWRELIETSDGTEAPETLERMQQALALAERRLLKLFEAYQHAAGLEKRRPSNVYFLDPARRSRL